MTPEEIEALVKQRLEFERLGHVLDPSRVETFRAELEKKVLDHLLQSRQVGEDLFEEVVALVRASCSAYEGLPLTLVPHTWMVAPCDGHNIQCRIDVHDYRPMPEETRVREILAMVSGIDPERIWLVDVAKEERFVSVKIHGETRQEINEKIEIAMCLLCPFGWLWRVESASDTLGEPT